MLTEEEIENRFGMHKATIEGPNPSAVLHRNTRRDFVLLADILNVRLPDGREKDVMFEHLETASMWAHKTLAKGQPITKDGE